MTPSNAGRARLHRAPDRRRHRRHRAIPESRGARIRHRHRAARSASSCIRRVAERPPERAADANVLQNMWWSLKLRMYARRAVARVGQAAAADPHLRAVSRPRFSRRPCRIRWACRKAWSAWCTPSPTAEMTRTNNVVIAHEILHTLGASDKYDPDTLAPLYPDRLRGAGPRAAFIRKSFTEIMAGRYADRRAHLRDAGVARRGRRRRGHRARDPLDPEMSTRCSKPRSCASRSRAGCSSTDSTAPSAPANSSRCWAAMAPANRCCCARWRDCARPPPARCARRPRHRSRWRVARSRMRLGFLPQDPEAAPQGSLRETVLLGPVRAPRASGKPRAPPMRSAWPQALADVGLEALAQRELGTLSGGEQRRAAIARLLVQAPSIYLLDEPTNHLDPAQQLGILERLRRSRATAPRSSPACTSPISRCAIADRACLLSGNGAMRTGRLRRARHRSPRPALRHHVTSKRAWARSASWRRADSARSRVMTADAQRLRDRRRDLRVEPARRDLFEPLTALAAPGTRSPGCAAADRAARPRRRACERALRHHEFGFAMWRGRRHAGADAGSAPVLALRIAVPRAVRRPRRLRCARALSAMLLLAL